MKMNNKRNLKREEFLTASFNDTLHILGGEISHGAIYLWGETTNLWFSIMFVIQCCVDVENTFFLWGFFVLFLLSSSSFSLSIGIAGPLWPAEQPNWPVQFLFCVLVQLLQLLEWCIFFFLFCPSYLFSLLLLHTQTAISRRVPL